LDLYSLPPHPCKCITTLTPPTGLGEGREDFEEEKVFGDFEPFRLHAVKKLTNPMPLSPTTANFDGGRIAELVGEDTSVFHFPEEGYGGFPLFGLYACLDGACVAVRFVTGWRGRRNVKRGENCFLSRKRGVGWERGCNLSFRLFEDISLAIL